jgi:glycosyltransferase involved in cell wall biosynthesis
MEGFGMSVAQAAMVAKPIVSSDTIPFTCFYLQDEAIIVPAGDIEGFAKGIRKLVENKDERKNRGSAAYKKARGLEWENLTKNFIIDLNKKDFDIPITEQVSQMLL